MKYLHFDTLEFMNELKSSGMPLEAAEGITRAFSKAFSKILDQKDLWPKADLTKEIREVKLEIQETRNEIKALRIELKAFIIKTFVGTTAIVTAIQTLLHFWK